MILFIVLVRQESNNATFLNDTIKSLNLNLPRQPLSNKIPFKKDSAKDPYILAHQYGLLDVDSGTIVVGKGQDTPVPIASITKVMTAVLAVENYKLSDVVTVSKEATQAIGSRILLKEGEQIIVENLLNGLLINSGNDAAYALAEYMNQKTGAQSIQPADPGIIASHATFINKMNAKAKELGLKHTRYRDPAGLDDEGLSTVREQGLLIAYALRNKTIASIMSKPAAEITSLDGKVVHKLDNSNRLVKEEMYFEGIIGGKTGFTPVAGHNLVAAATRDGHMLVAIIIKTNDTVNKAASAIEAKKLLTWGFANLEWY